MSTAGGPEPYSLCSSDNSARLGEIGQMPLAPVIKTSCKVPSCLGSPYANLIARYAAGLPCSLKAYEMALKTRRKARVCCQTVARRENNMIALSSQGELVCFINEVS